MTVLFICSSAEPGRDGVGDYTRRLAAELLSQGHQAVIIGLHDRHLVPARLTERQSDGERKVTVLRFSTALAWEHRLAEAADFMIAANPDWISLQYVSYGFQDQGLPWRLPRRIRQLAGHRKLHVMFHELWLDKPVNFKEQILSRLQKTSISRAISEMKPAVTNVTIPFNYNRLKIIKHAAVPLALFGNVPIATEHSIMEDTLSGGEKHLLYFGTPPKGLFLEKLVGGLTSYCAGGKKKLRMTIVSGYSEQTNRFVSLLRERLDESRVTISDLGFVSLEKLSALMATCDAGIARSEPHLLGKSGTAVAMLEHGLPVWMPKWNGISDLHFEFRSEMIYADLRDALCAPVRCAPCSLLSETARNFIDQLTRSYP